MFSFDKPLLDTFSAVEIRTADLDVNGRFAGSVTTGNERMLFRLRSGHGTLPDSMLVSLQSIRIEGALQPCYNADVLGTDISIVGDGYPDVFGLVLFLSGSMEMVAGPSGHGIGDPANGLMLRGSAGTRVLTTDDTTRLCLWFESARIERVLAALLGATPRRALAFAPTIDWSQPGARRVRRLVAHLVEEMRDPDGLTSQPVARETFTDLFMQALLLGLEHNHGAAIAGPKATAIPAHLRRAEAFMHDAAARPISLADVADAAGCGLGALQAAFHRFRDTTALSALHDIRLQHARAALLATEARETTRTIARRFGFTNPSRFITAYGRRFGETPGETRRRAGH